MCFKGPLSFFLSLKLRVPPFNFFFSKIFLCLFLNPSLMYSFPTLLPRTTRRLRTTDLLRASFFSSFSVSSSLPYPNRSSSTSLEKKRSTISRPRNSTIFFRNSFSSSFGFASSYSTLPSAHIQPITSSSPSTVASYDEAVSCYLALSGDPLQALQKALQTDGNCIMVHILHVCLCLLGTSIGGNHPSIQESRKLVSTLVQKHYQGLLTLTSRELTAALAMEALAHGRWRFACQIWENRLAMDPADITFLRLVHDTYFFLGDSRNLRDGIGRSWSIWTPSMPNYGRVTGMLAFGLEENGVYDKAEELAMASLGMDPTDVWATHAAVHVYEMMGRREEGDRLLRETEDEWSKSNMFARHVYWHWALFALQTGTVGYRQALNYYDQALGSYSAEQAQAEILTLVDATALLWRLELFHHPLQLLPHPKHTDNTNVPPSKDYIPGVIRKDDKHLLKSLTLFPNNRIAHQPVTTRWNQLAYHWKYSLNDCLTTNQHLNVFNDIHAGMVFGANENWHHQPKDEQGNSLTLLPSVSSSVLTQSMTKYIQESSSSSSSGLFSSSSQGFTNDQWLNDLVKRDGYQLQELLGKHHHINHQYSILPLPWRNLSSSSSLILPDSGSITSYAGSVHDNWAVTASIGKTVTEAMIAFTKNDYITCYQGLLKTRPYWSFIGGSHAQRDILDQTLIFAAVGANEWSTARALCSERVINRSNDGLAWYLYGSILNRIANGDYLPIDDATKQIYLTRAADYKSRAYVLGVDQGPTY